ncbi:hypothetical protein [Periweissella cryptocerci]|uniref:hypothetical protein n=1 Tax=Periweissella cryptocerci TaxID=2506420 RepID=UPI001FA9896C|nr:hypothetical protein [Periweissella cryptocerci]
MAVHINQPLGLLIAFLLLGLSLQDFLTQTITPIFAWIVVTILLPLQLLQQPDFIKLAGALLLLAIGFILVKQNLLGSGDIPIILILWLFFPLFWFSWALVIGATIGIVSILIRKRHQLAFVPCLSIGYWVVAVIFN